MTWRGRVPYGEALDAQRAWRERLIAGEVPEALWLLEHDPVVTTGRRTVDDLPSAAILAAAGYASFVTERGGLATCHAPGQLVGYLLIDARAIGVRRVVAAIETGVVAWLAGEGLAAGPREGYPGVWVGREKVCAVGLHVRRGFTMHGFALNLVNELRGFELITPCGITDGGVTSIGRLCGHAPSPAEAAGAVGAAVARALLDARNPLR